MNIKSIYLAIEKYLFETKGVETNPLNAIINRRSLNSFIVLSLIGIFVMPCHMTGHTGRAFLPCKIFTSCQVVVFIAMQIAVWTRKIKVRTALIIAISVMFGKQIFDSLVFSYVLKCDAPEKIITGCYVMCIAAIIFTVTSHLRRLSLIMSTIMFVCYIACDLVPTNSNLVHSYWYFGIIFCAILILSISNYHHVGIERWLATQIDNSNYETKKVIDLLSTVPDMESMQVKSLIERLSDMQRKQLIENVENYLNQKTLLSQQIEAKWPDLTFSEIEICILIFKGMALKEICSELNKSETTISSHRSHIRQKLGLERNDNLQLFLRSNLR